MIVSTPSYHQSYSHAKRHQTTHKPTEKLYRITDFDGLCIEVKPTGKKFWRFRFRYLDKALMMTLVEYPVVGLAEARRLRERC